MYVEFIGKKTPFSKLNFIHRPLTLKRLGGGAQSAPPFCFLGLTKKNSPITYNETLCKFLIHTCGNYNALIWLKKKYLVAL